MAEIKYFTAVDPALERYRGAMRAMIDAEACKLGVANPSAYFTADNDYMLALKHGALVALCVIKRRPSKTATYLGYLLTIVKPEERRGGLTARMWLRYMTRRLPGMLWATLRCPRHRIYVYADIGSPIVYAKLGQLKLPLYPDLIHGDTPEQRRQGFDLRSELVERCDIRNMWQRPGLFRDVDFATGIIQDFGGQAAKADGAAGLANGTAPARDDFNLDRLWHTRWHDYVPPHADLLVVVPFTVGEIVQKLASLFYAARPKLRRRRDLSLAPSAMP